MNCTEEGKENSDFSSDGFSSQEQSEEDKQILTNFNDIDFNTKYTKIPCNDKMIMIPPQQLKLKSYSLQPDISTGWIPKIIMPKPITLLFDNQQFDFLCRNVTQSTKKNQYSKICYLGPRFDSTFYAWMKMPFDSPYHHNNKTEQIKFSNRKFVGQNPLAHQDVHFDSFFQSGNLDSVFKVGQQQYDLFMRVDSNTRGHLQWYNFKVFNMRAGLTYQFNICNFRKYKSLYCRGMKPYIRSKCRQMYNRIGWEQGGSNVSFQSKKCKTYKKNEQQQNEKIFKLSFSYGCIYDNDEVQFAYCVPYTYTDLLEYIKKLNKKHQSQNIFKVGKLGLSLGGLNMPLLTITANVNQQSFNTTTKKVIVATGRIHPGQSNGSYTIQGFIDFLLSDQLSSQYLRDNVIFKIVPMMNPDGVALGNYRTGTFGKDLNRQFIKPDKDIFPQIYQLKQMIKMYSRIYKQSFLMFLDFHGHSIKKNAFAYGPEFPITKNNYYQCRIFPKLISTHTEMFRYYSCIFKVTQFKESTARAILFKQFNIPFTFTIQVSNGSYYSHKQLKSIDFDQKAWKQIGKNIGQAVYDYTKMIKEQDDVKRRKKILREKKVSLLRQRVKKVESKRYNKPNNLTVNGNFPKIRQKIYSKHSQSLVDETQKINRLSFLLQKLNEQIPRKQNDLQSDDQISEGGSDSQTSSQNLDDNYLKIIMHQIKDKKHRKFSPSIKKNRKKNKNHKCKTIMNQVCIQVDQLQNEQKKICERVRSRSIILKNNLFRKKSSKSLLSSNKEDSKMNAAKLVTFNFNITPYPMTINSQALGTKSSIDSPQKVQIGNLEQRRLRRFEHLQGFKRTLISANKQSVRKEGHKNNMKYCTDPQNCFLEDVKGIKMYKQK